MNIEPINEETTRIVEEIKIVMEEKASNVDAVLTYKEHLNDIRLEYLQSVDRITGHMIESKKRADAAETRIQNLYKEYHKIVNESKQKKEIK